MLSDHFGLAAVGPESRPAEALGAAVALAGAGFAALSIIQTRRLDAVGTYRRHRLLFHLPDDICRRRGAGARAGLAGGLWRRRLLSRRERANGALWRSSASRAASRKFWPPTSYRYADASLLASFDYLAMLWALLASLAFFGQWPSSVVLAGAAAIAVSGLLAILGERHARRKAAALAPF